MRKKVVTYTNRKGVKYFLCRGITKKGKTRFFFSLECRAQEAVESIPKGYQIKESVNGVVSLAKFRPSLLLESEIRAVKDALAKHPRNALYRLDVKPETLIIYEFVGPDPRELIGMVGESSLLTGLSGKSRLDNLVSELLARRNFTPVMRFTLMDRKKRTYRAERMCYLGSIDGWVEVAFARAIEELACTLIPVLGTDGFFELGR